MSHGQTLSPGRRMLKLKASSFQQSTKAKYSNKGKCCNNRWNSREFNFNKMLTKNNKKITAIMPIKSAINLLKFKIFSSRLTTLLLLLEDDYLFVFL